MCDCVELINAELAESNTVILQGLDFSGKDRTVIYVQTTKVDTKKRGKAASLVARYYPFCGNEFEGFDTTEDERTDE